MSNNEGNNEELNKDTDKPANPFQQAYVGPPNTQAPIYTPPNFPTSAAPSNDPPQYSAYPPQPYPPSQPYPPPQYATAQYPPQPYPPQPYPPSAYPPQPYPPNAYPAAPYPNQPAAYPVPVAAYPPVEQPVIVVHTQTAHAIDRTQPLPCGGLGYAWLLFILGWFIGISWFIGAFFTCLGDPRERRGGRACLIILIVWAVLITVFTLY